MDKHLVFFAAVAMSLMSRDHCCGKRATGRKYSIRNLATYCNDFEGGRKGHKQFLFSAEGR